MGQSRVQGGAACGEELGMGRGCPWGGAGCGAGLGSARGCLQPAPPDSRSPQYPLLSCGIHCFFKNVMLIC